MKNQALFSIKNKSKKKIKVSSATILPGFLRVRTFGTIVGKNGAQTFYMPISFPSFYIIICC